MAERGDVQQRGDVVRTVRRLLFGGPRHECCVMGLIKSQQATAAGTSTFLLLSLGDGQNTPR